MIRENANLSVGGRLEAVINLIDRGDAALRDDLTVLAIDDAKAHAEREAGRDAAIVETADSQAADGEDEVLLSLTVPSQADRLKLVRNAVKETAMFCGCDEDMSRDIVIAVDEACQNIIRHAYGGSPHGEIEMKISRHGDELTILLRDFAETIDVSKVKPRDLDDVKPGGLGTHFMREVMDEVEFMPPPGDGGNLLRMMKRL